jgi:hypothetical protein
MSWFLMVLMIQTRDYGGIDVLMIFGISLFIPDLAGSIAAVRSKVPEGLSTVLKPL